MRQRARKPAPASLFLSEGAAPAAASTSVSAPRPRKAHTKLTIQTTTTTASTPTTMPADAMTRFTSSTTTTSEVSAASALPTSSNSSSSSERATVVTLVRDHVTNTGAVVTVEQINYSDAMRAYRVCRQDAVGVSYNIHPVLRLLSVGNMILCAATLTFLVPCLLSAHAGPLPQWLQTATRHDAFVRGREQLEAALSFRTRLLLLLCFLALFAHRLYSTCRRVYVEEVLAIHGVGLQIATYDMFNKLLSKRFVDLRMIRSIVIHDAFFRYQPIFFLSSSVENVPRRTVYFEHTLPRLQVLQPVLRGLRHTLYGVAEEGRSLAEIEEAQRENDDDEGELNKAEFSGADDTTLNTSDVNSDAASTEGDDELKWL